MHESIHHNQWFIEFFTPYEAHMHGIKGFLASVKTLYQQMDFVEHCRYGKTLFLDGKIQSSAGDEYIYHEAIVHPAMIAHPNPKKVIIIGGGEGATLREVLKHNTVASVTMIDIDEELVKACIKYLPEWSNGAFNDSRTNLVFADGRKYLAENRELFDVVIIDLPEPLEGGPAYLLYTKEFYHLVSERLSKDGTVVTQAATTRAGDTILISSVLKTFKTAFPIAYAYQVIVPSFDLPWGFGIASKTFDPSSKPPEEIDAMLEKRAVRGLRYYDGVTHQGMFSLPKFLRKDLSHEGVVIEESKPLFLDV